MLAAFAAVVSPQLGAPPLERAEVYFADAARGMVESGDWVVPRYQGQRFFDKPILSYWLMAAAMRAFGEELAVVRLVPLAAALGVLLATVWLGSLLFDRRSGLAGAIVLGSTLAFVSFARVAMSDMLLSLWTTLAACLGLRAYRPPKRLFWTPLLGAVLGLGFATKGPIALLVAGVALALVAWRERRQGLPGGGAGLGLGAAAFALIAFGWFALVYTRLGPEPLAYFFLRENLERFSGAYFDVGRPFWFYLEAYLLHGLPWSPLLPVALLRLWQQRREGAGGLDSPALLALWVAIVLVPLSLSGGKIDYYLLPLYPALSLLIGRYLAAGPWLRLDRLLVRVVLLLTLALVVVALVVAPRLPDAWLPGRGPRLSLAATLVACGIALAAVVAHPRAGRVLGVLAATVAAVFVQLAAFYLPAYARAQPNRAIVADVIRELRYQPQARLALCQDPTRARRDVLFHARHAAAEQCPLWNCAVAREPYLLLATPREAESFAALPGYRHIADYSYLPSSTLTFESLLKPPRPDRLVLCANFFSWDPEAERKRKREYRKAVQRDRALLEAAAARGAPTTTAH